MKYYLAIFSVFSILVLAGCDALKVKDGDQAIIECPLGTMTDGVTCKVVTNKYVYSSEYGGRSATASDYTGTNSSKNFAVPDGWYDGTKTVSIVDSNLAAMNIRVGSTIFGTAGTLPASAAAGCTPDTGVAAGADCTASSGNYVYNEVYGGRGTVCNLATDPIAITTACWLNVTGKYLYTTGAGSIINCTSEGLQSSQCNITSPNYWYTTAYNGRSAVCSNVNTGTTNGSACWVNSAGTNIYGGSACATTGLNASSCTASSGNYVYTSLYGGRDTNCVDDNNGNCYINSANKVDVATKLLATNIRDTIVIFGVTGNNTGLATSWGSGMHRDKATGQITHTQEATTYSPSGADTPLPAGYHPIPKIAKDNEGYVVGTQVVKVDRTGWNATTCGIAQATIPLRIANCATAFGANAQWTSANGNAGQVTWNLVSRNGNIAAGMAQEVWQDDNTKLLWSSLVSSGINWCKASGSSNNQSTLVVNQALNEIDPNGYCSSQTYQEQSTPVASVNPELAAISACTELDGYTTTDASIANTGKAGLTKTSTPKVAWRLPTTYDYMVANVNGIRFVLPDMLLATSGPEWTATYSSTNTAQAWTFDSQTGSRSRTTRTVSLPVRCVGR